MDVQREQPVIMVCVCRLGAHGRDSCAAYTSGPDEPLCTYCVAAKHPEDPTFTPIIKVGHRAGTAIHVV